MRGSAEIEQNQWARVLNNILSLGGSMKDCQRYRGEGNADWTCLNCNNLNYSFRKICNRCKAYTREENDQHLLQMQYYHMYYQQPLFPAPAPASPELQPEKLRKVSLSTADHSPIQDKTAPDAAVKEWNLPESDSTLVFLLEQAWEGLYSCGEEEACKSWEEVENTRQEEGTDEQGEGILTNFDFTFI